MDRKRSQIRALRLLCDRPTNDRTDTLQSLPRHPGSIIPRNQLFRSHPLPQPFLHLLSPALVPNPPLHLPQYLLPAPPSPVVGHPLLGRAKNHLLGRINLRMPSPPYPSLCLLQMSRRNYGHSLILTPARHLRSLLLSPPLPPRAVPTSATICDHCGLK